MLLLLLFAHAADWVPCSWVKAIFLLFDLYDPLIIYHFHPFCCLLSTSNPSAPTLINIIEIEYPTINPSSSSDQRHLPPHQPCRWRTLYGLICHER